MSHFNRRQILQSGVVGLAASGAASLTLHAGTEPTVATADEHGYEEFLNRKGIPRIAPTGKWSPTHEDILGPFFVSGAPFRGKVCPPLEPGDTLMINGRVWGHDTKKPIANSVLDVWQADAQGNYDMSDPRRPPERSNFKNRIRLVADETGFYEYETIRPAAYQIGQGILRPSHIHYMIQAPGYRQLITQLYFEGDPHNKTDQFARNSDLLVNPKIVKVQAGSYQLGTFDIVLKPV